MVSTAPRPSCARRRPKPQRLLRYTPPLADSTLGHVRITQGAEVKLYWFREFKADGGRGFEFEQYSPEVKTYHVFLSADPKTLPSSCDCPGQVRWGSRTTCRHLGAVQTLAQLGKI